MKTVLMLCTNKHFDFTTPKGIKEEQEKE